MRWPIKESAIGARREELKDDSTAWSVATRWMVAALAFGHGGWAWLGSYIALYLVLRYLVLRFVLALAERYLVVEGAGRE